MSGKYIYGIIKSGDSALEPICGLGTSSTVYALAYHGLDCLVSDYSGRDFGCISKEEVIRCLLAHQMVVEHIMKKHTVLPAKFGTVLATSNEVRDLLSQGYQQFVDALAWIQDKVEVEVVATWDTGRVLQEISLEPEFIRAREATPTRLGQVALEERIHIGQMVKASMDRRRDSYRERMIDFLRPVAVDLQPNALVSDEMVMNVAFLIEEANQEEFDNCVSQLDELFHGQIKFRVIGPLPPYSFATVEVTRPSPEKIEEAKQLLHLSEVISELEVRRAYRRLAAETHPDRRSGDELAKARFIKLRQASDILITYCRGQAESSGSLLIRIKRVANEEVQHLHSVEIGGIAGVAHG